MSTHRKDKRSKTSESVSFRLDVDKYQALERIAESERRHLGQLCRIIVGDYLANKNVKPNGAAA